MEARRGRIELTNDRPSLAERLRLSYMDPWMLTAAIFLIAFSVFTLGSATQDDIPGQPLYFTFRQALYGLIGIAVMIAVARFDYSRLREVRIGLYSLMIGSILLVCLFGAAARGSRRWIELPYFLFQPSELAKVILIVALAGFAIEMTRRMDDPRRTIRLLLLGTFPALLVFLQPDLGTALVLGFITLTILFLSGAPWKHLVAIGGVVVALGALVLVAAPAAGVPVLRAYQQERLTSFLSPSANPAEAGYQVNQALIAIGSGGKTGRGGDSTQADLRFLPERHTDFIFAVIGERFGFLGAGFVICLYALLIWRALRLLIQSKNFYGTLVVGGIAAMLLFQVFVNIGMNLGLMPVTGITLPLMSYGGSSVLVTFLAIGLMQAVHVQMRLEPGDGANNTPLR
ncbi:MAG: rod shape-determining protein RodA [bacterium]